MSFLSVEPQPRALLENFSKSLLAQFDTQLDIVADRYLAFFQERRNIEATYIESLQKLHRKAKTVDASFDPLAEPTTTRAAWDTVRDILEKEANTQQAFLDILDNSVVKPLGILKKSNDETRKRIEKDLKAPAVQYTDFSEKKISKLQEAYLKKYHSRFGGSRREDLRGPVPAKSEEVSNECRWAVAHLNYLRSMRAESLGDGYDCLEELVFTPTIKDVLVEYMEGMNTACAKYDNLAKSTRAEVEKVLAGSDTSDLRASFRRALSFSIPPLTLYRNYLPGAYSDSDLVFGVPLVELKVDQDNVPKVMRMCIEEVEKRGLNTNKIYSGDGMYETEMLQLRRRSESERLSFSFSSTDNIYSVAMFLQRYLWELPEPLFALSLQDYRDYGLNRARYAENDFSLLRSKIRELHPVHRASLQALLRHLFRVASHSDKNAMTMEALTAQFSSNVFRGDKVLQDGVDVKGLVLEDLIQNVHNLFDECPPSSDPHVERHLEPTDPLGVPPTGISVVAEWRLHQSRLPPDPEAATIPQSPPESVLSIPSDFPLSSATSSHTEMGRLSP